MGQAIAHIRLAIEPVAQQARQLAREGVGDHAGTLDQAGVAMAGAATGLVAVDEDHLATASLQVKGRADANDTGAQNDGLTMHWNSPHRQAISAGGGPVGLLYV
ncbi:hypothetical protein D3C76_1600880 [compost metagenome]